MALERLNYQEKIANSQCVINFEVRNSQDCFIYAIMIALHHTEFIHKERIQQYAKYYNDFDLSKIVFPVCSMQIQKFEHCNKNISVFTHTYSNKGPECIYRTSFSERPQFVHIFNHQNHWLPITNLTAFYRQGRAKYFK